MKEPKPRNGLRPFYENGTLRNWNRVLVTTGQRRRNITHNRIIVALPFKLYVVRS